MNKVLITAEYDPATRTITVQEPLEGVRSGDSVRIEMPHPVLADEERRARLERVRGSITDPTFFEAIESMFPPWDGPDEL